MNEHVKSMLDDMCENTLDEDGHLFEILRRRSEGRINELFSTKESLCEAETRIEVLNDAVSRLEDINHDLRAENEKQREEILSMKTHEELKEEIIDMKKENTND